MIEHNFRNEIGRSTFYNKYALTQSDTWPERSRMVMEDVVGTMHGRRRRLISKSEQDELVNLMVQMKFIPGGRYIYYGGRPAHFFNNCFSGATQFMTPSGYRSFNSCKNGEKVTVLSPSDGLWHNATVNLHGEQELFNIKFSCVKGNQQTIRTVSATKDHRWLLADGTIQNGLKVGDIVPAVKPMYGVDNDGFLHGFIFGDGNRHKLKSGFAHQLRLCGSKSDYLDRLEASSLVQTVTYPPSAGGDPVLYVRSQVDLKCLPLAECSPEYIRGFIEGWVAADGHIGSGCKLHCVSREAMHFFVDYAHFAGYIITGEIRSCTTPSNFGERRELFVVSFQSADTFSGFKVKSIDSIGVHGTYCVSEPDTTLFTLHQGMATGNCFLLRAEEDTREEWAELSKRSISCLMTGGGIGIDYSILRGRGRSVGRTGGVASGPLSLAEMINGNGRHVMQGGSRRSAIYGSLNWQHSDAWDWINAKDWDNIPLVGTGMTVGDMKRADFNFHAPLDMTNISLNYDDDFLELEELPDIYLHNVLNAMRNGEPGFSFNFGSKSLETLRNACCEVTSEDDSDVCNLGAVNMANIETLEEFRDVVSLASKFLVCGTLRADLPYKKVYEVRDKNRRLGLGLMGVHEWLLRRGYRYEMNDELREWLKVYKEESERSANEHCDRLYLSRPKGYRAIAPTGTIGILA